MLLPLPDKAGTENMDACLKVGALTHTYILYMNTRPEKSVELISGHALFQEGLKVWAHQIQSGVCLIDSKKLPEDTELTAGQVENSSES